ncbi:MAG: helix-turn-helix domain-containing protein [Allorhizobium sp.]
MNGLRLFADLMLQTIELERRLAALEPPRRRPKHHATDDQIARIRTLSDSGMTQKKIAEKLGVHPRTVRKYAGRAIRPHKAYKRRKKPSDQSSDIVRYPTN